MALAEQCRKNALHDLRVDLKILRAQLRLLRAVDPAFPYSDLYAPYKALFARAGQVRFWQLQAGILADTPGVPEPFARLYRAHAHRRLREALEAFRQTALAGRLFLWPELKKEFRQSAWQCTPLSVGTYFETLRKGMAAITAHLSRRNPQAMHDLRKWLKEYAINRRLANRHFGFDPGPPLVPRAENAGLDELLGQWHDLDAACMQLQEDLQTQQWEPADRNAGETMLQDWREAERMLWEEVLAGLETGGLPSTQ